MRGNYANLSRLRPEEGPLKYVWTAALSSETPSSQSFHTGGQNWSGSVLCGCRVSRTYGFGPSAALKIFQILPRQQVKTSDFLALGVGQSLARWHCKSGFVGNDGWDGGGTCWPQPAALMASQQANANICIPTKKKGLVSLKKWKWDLCFINVGQKPNTS